MCLTENVAVTTLSPKFKSPVIVFREQRSSSPEHCGILDGLENDSPDGETIRIDENQPLISCGVPRLLSGGTTIPIADQSLQDGTIRCRNATVIRDKSLNSLHAIVQHNHDLDKHGYPDPLGSLLRVLDQEWNSYLNSAPGSKLSSEKLKPRWKLTNDPHCFGETIFARIISCCFSLGLQFCDTPECNIRKVALRRSAPACEWGPFRELILTLLACWMPNVLVVLSHIILEKRSSSEIPYIFCLDIHGMIDLWRWARRIAFGTSHDGPAMMEQNVEFQIFDELWVKLAPGYQLRAVNISDKVSEHGYCKTRLWNVANQGPRAVADLIHVASLALTSVKRVQKRRHADCTEQYCLFSNDNSTLIKQSHKCKTPRCEDQMTFPPSILNQSFAQIHGPISPHTWFQTAWNLFPESTSQTSSEDPKEIPTLCGQQEGYMAISHVWSDGTGVGMKTPGQVNRCLYTFFEKIAKQLDCSGIWWDAISIPTERDARRVAINTMLKNFEMAKVTVVHDEELINFPWKEDGSPAVALILSAWFTRGWTAAELFASRDHPVKVLFGDPSEPFGMPLIKDLDEDILAWDIEIDLQDLSQPKKLHEISSYRAKHLRNAWGLVHHQGQFAATDIISNLRYSKGPLTPVSDGDERFNEHSISSMGTLRGLLRVLRPRTTSWNTDRMLIAGLMCLPPEEMESTVSGAHITKQLLCHFGALSIHEVFHDEIPISQTGPWSWCPQSIFDLSQSRMSQHGTHSEQCLVSGSGVLIGRFSAYTILREDIVIPCGNHPALAARVSAALATRQKCLLLTHPIYDHGQYILAMPVSTKFLGSGKTGRIACRWITCVYLGSPLSAKDRSRHVLPTQTKRERDQAPVVEAELANWYEFGADTDETGKPLAPMDVQSVFRGVEGWRRSVWEDGKFRWYLSDGYHDPESKTYRRWPPQQVCLFPFEIGPLVGETEDRWLRSIAATTFDHSTPENQIRKPFLTRILETLGASILPCAKEHIFVCEGIVNLAWSFPYMTKAYKAWQRPTNKAMIRCVFKSTFHITQEVNNHEEEYEMSIGVQTFQEQILPVLCVKPTSQPEEMHGTASTTPSSSDAFIYSSYMASMEDNVQADQKAFGIIRAA